MSDEIITTTKSSRSKLKKPLLSMVTAQPTKKSPICEIIDSISNNGFDWNSINNSNEPKTEKQKLINNLLIDFLSKEIGNNTEITIKYRYMTKQIKSAINKILTDQNFSEEDKQNYMPQTNNFTYALNYHKLTTLFEIEEKTEIKTKVKTEGKTEVKTKLLIVKKR